MTQHEAETIQRSEGGLATILPPGKPIQKALVESFNGKCQSGCVSGGLEADPEPGTGGLCDLPQCSRGRVDAPTLKPGHDRLRSLHALCQLGLGQSGTEAGLNQGAGQDRIRA